MNISLGIAPISLPVPSAGPGSPASTTGTFADAIGAAINQVDASSATAKAAASDLLIGGKGDIHEVALASQRAELSLELFQQVRNKFVSAYQEIMKMPM
jgi:flagellar hook-basal body complex protein FliE